MLDACGGVQWPWPESTHSLSNEPPNTEALPAIPPKSVACSAMAVSSIPMGKRDLSSKLRGLFRQTSKEFPLVLLTGRGTSAQWHTGTRTAKSDVLRKLYPNQIYVEISAEDAAQIGIESGIRVRVRSPRDEVIATAFVSPAVAPGQVFMPMHYAETNNLTFWHVDPYSRQPNYKHCAVSVSRA